jgi:hypothetical protein
MTSGHRPASHTCVPETNSGSRHRPQHDRTNCSCRVSQSDTSPSAVQIDLRFDITTITTSTPLPLTVFRLISIQPSALDGHLRLVDHPPMLS